MHDVSDRREVGVLAFEESVVDIQPSPFVPIDIEKLTIRDEDVVAESGIRSTGTKWFHFRGYLS